MSKAKKNTLKEDTYHHGDLRRSLLVAAETELVNNGTEKFSLRSCAKRAGVSHAAPAHHFKNTDGLLHALAFTGRERLASVMQDHQKSADLDGQSQLVAAGLGYVQFAIDNPQLFQLMYGGRSVAAVDMEAKENDDAAFSVMINAVSKLRGANIFRSEEGWGLVAAIWSLVHGYADLAVAGRMRFATRQPRPVQDGYLENMLKRIVS